MASLSIDACTPLGTEIGYFAIRDMMMFSLGHVAQHFAANATGASLAIGHDTPGRGHDRHAQTVHDGRDGLAATIDAQTGTGYAINAFDDRTSGVVFQRDFQDWFFLLTDNLVAFDIAFVLKHGCNSGLQLRGGHADRLLVDHLRVTHAGQHVGDRIAHAHRYVPPTSWI